MAFVLFFSVASPAAEDYFVEPLRCTGQWNALPAGIDAKYAKVGLQVVSVWSVRSSDCSLRPASGSYTVAAPVDKEVEFVEAMDLWAYLSGPVRRNEDKVFLPYGIFGNALALNVEKSEIKDGVQVDTLSGQDRFSDDFYYDLKCEATVVKSPSQIQNTTKCPTPAVP